MRSREGIEPRAGTDDTPADRLGAEAGRSGQDASSWAIGEVSASTHPRGKAQVACWRRVAPRARDPVLLDKQGRPRLTQRLGPALVTEASGPPRRATGHPPLGWDQVSAANVRSAGTSPSPKVDFVHALAKRKCTRCHQSQLWRRRGSRRRRLAWSSGGAHTVGKATCSRVARFRQCELPGSSSTPV
jgi:hypothetical protein